MGTEALKMMKEFLFIEKDKVIGEMEMKNFLDWFENSVQFELWSSRYPDKDYASKRAKHDLGILEDYVWKNGEANWENFKIMKA